VPYHIKKYNPDDEFYFKEGCYIVETSNTADDGDVSISQARLPAGERTRWHYLHETFERYIIVRGTGLVEVGPEDPCEVTPGDVVLIPPQTRQRITNIGEDDLVFMVVCTPRFSHRNYYDLE